MDGRAWRNFVLVYLTLVATRALGLWQQFMKTGLLICCFVLNLVPKLTSQMGFASESFENF